MGRLDFLLKTSYLSNQDPFVYLGQEEIGWTAPEIPLLPLVSFWRSSLARRRY